ncbi:MAG: cysteine--tRNA ligase, partial [Chloroflexi bacterium]|nr:cysteine--tRNA ligase [Chloroflexota bacterium]
LGLADWQPVQDEIPDEIVQLATQRQQARAEKRWQDADALRDQIATAGFTVQDSADGFKIRVIEG